MHILLGIITLLGAAAAWYWRAQRAKDMLDAAADGAGRLKGAYNRHKFRKQTEGSVLSGVKDAQTAATIFLVYLAEEKQPLLKEDEIFIAELLTSVTGADQRSLDEAISFAKWVSGEVSDGNDVVRKFLPIWRDQLNFSQRAELIDMATQVSAHHGTPAPVQTALIRRMRDGLTS